MSTYIRWFREIRLADLPLVGGRNASLGVLYGELTQAGVRVPNGFAVTADAYSAVLEHGKLREEIATALRGVDAQDLQILAEAGTRIRCLVETVPWPLALAEEILDAYRALADEPGRLPTVAVWSSATTEDLPGASCDGQQETYMDVRGGRKLLAACRRCFASLFTDRAIAYRIHHGLDHLTVRLSIGVQRMVRANIGVSGVMFTVDSESGSRDVVVINAAYGLGEAVVQGRIDPDEIWLFKPTLGLGREAILKRQPGRKDWKLVFGPDGTPARAVVGAEEAARLSVSDTEAIELARAAVAIERHYGKPMTIEWTKDGENGHIYILQARSETIHRAETRRWKCSGSTPKADPSGSCPATPATV